jgi:hypothetical protein
MTKKKSAYGPKFMLVKWFVICTDEERLYAHTSLQQILRKSKSSTWRGRETISFLLTVRVVRAEVMSRGLCEPARGSSLSVMRNTRFVADFGALWGINRSVLHREVVGIDGTRHGEPSYSS